MSKHNSLTITNISKDKEAEMFTDWSDWASIGDYGLDDIYVTDNKDEALIIANRVNGNVTKCKEGFVISNQFGGMVNRYDYFTDIDAARKVLICQ